MAGMAAVVPEDQGQLPELQELKAQEEVVVEQVRLTQLGVINLAVVLVVPVSSSSHILHKTLPLVFLGLCDIINTFTFIIIHIRRKNTWHILLK
jgi:hypothetical protein